MGVHSSATEIQTPTHRNLNGRSMTAPSSVIVQQYSSVTVVVLPSHSRQQKFPFAFQKSYYIDFFLLFFFFKLLKYEST